MLLTLSRFLATHKVIQVDGAIGALLARANTPLQVLSVLNTHPVSPSTKVFAIRRIASTLNSSPNTSELTQSSLYTGLINDVTGYISAASYSDLASVVFWLRVSKQKNTKIIPETHEKMLKMRIIEGIQQEKFTSHQFIPLFYDIFHLKWDLSSFLPYLIRLLSDPHQLISWDHYIQTLLTCEMAKMPAMDVVYEKIYMRMREENMERVDAETVVRMLEVVEEVGEAGKRIRDACVETVMGKLPTAPITVPTRLLKSFIQSPRQLTPLHHLACQAILNHTSPLPTDTALALLQFTSILTVFKHKNTPSISENMVKSITGRVLDTLGYSRLKRIVMAMATLQVKWPQETMVTLGNLRRKLRPDSWSAFSAVIFSHQNLDFSPFLSDLQSINNPNDLQKLERLAALKMLPKNTEIDHLIAKYETELLDYSKKDAGKALIPIFLHFENRGILPISSVFGGFLEEFLPIIGVFPVSNEILRLFFICFPAFPELIPSILRNLPISSHEILKFVQIIKNTRNLLDLLRFFAIIRPKSLSLLTLSTIISQNYIGKRSESAVFMRNFLNNSYGNPSECKLFIKSLEKWGELIDEDVTSCEKFLGNGVKWSEMSVKREYESLMWLGKLMEWREVGEVGRKVKGMVGDEGEYGELLVKITRGELDMFDSHLPLLSITSPTPQICNKLISVSLRRSPPLTSLFQTQLHTVLPHFPISQIAEFIHFTRKYPETAPFRNILFHEITKKWKKELILPETGLFLLEFMIDSRQFHQNIAENIFEYLKNNLNILEIDQIIDFLYFYANFGVEIDLELVQKAMEIVGNREIYWEYLVDALYQLDLLESSLGKEVISRYFDGNIEKNIPKKAIFPLIRAKIVSQNEIFPIIADKIDIFPQSQRLLYRLLSNPGFFSGPISLSTSNFTLKNNKPYGDWKWLSEFSRDLVRFE